MKTIIITTALLGITSVAFATSISAPSGMIGTGKLNGSYAYTWTVASGPLVSGETVDSASLVFSNIKLTSSGSGNNISYDLGRVFSGLIAKPSTLPTPGNFGTYTDNDASGDAFAQNIVNGNAKNLGNKALTLNVLTSWTYTFDTSALTALNSYASQGSWGFLIDPDCLFNVGGITFNYTTAGSGGSVPDGGITAMLLGAAMLGLGWAKRRVSA
jgi:hypothetical protein